MAIIPQNLDYTDKDFDSIVARQNLLLASVFPDWTDFSAPNFGNTLKELFAHVMDVLLFYQDKQAAESRLTDVKQRKNAIALAKMLGFVPSGATAAQAALLVTLDVVPGNDVNFSAGQIVRTRNVANPIRFQFLGDLTIPAAADPPQAFVDVENSENFEEEFQSTGLRDQEFRLSGVPFLDDSLILTAQNGLYEVVDNFLDSGPLDRHITILVDQDDRATVRFGDGVNGQVPIGLITALYKTGGGLAGNVEAGTIRRIEGAFTDVLGNPVNVTVTNPEKASNGTDRQNVEQIKLRAPQSVRVSDRTVGLDDYVIGAESVSGVARALMLTSDQAIGIEENRGRLYVVPVGGGVPTETLKNQVLQAVTVDKPNTITFKVTVEDPIYALFDIDITVFKASGFSGETVKANILANLQSFFAIQNEDGTPNEQIDFGFASKGFDGSPVPEVPLMGPLLAGIIESTTGVRKVGDRDQDYLINGIHQDAQLAVFEFPQLGTVTIVDGDTGLVL